MGRIHRIDVRLSAAVLAQLVADYEFGASTAELQARFGLSKGSVRSILHGSGVRVRRQPLTDEVVDTIVELYESGLSIRETAKALGLPKTTVQNALARTDVVMRPAVRVRRTGQMRP
jgi:DNA-directed RNA polymerase specialized sigma24 family protein